jgi:histidine kinase
MIRQGDKVVDWDDLPGVDADSRVWIGVPLTTWDVTTGLLCMTVTDPTIRRDDVIETLIVFNQRARLALENSRLLIELVASKGDLHEAKTSLVRTAELAIAGEIATGVAHQISNPLTSVMAHAHLLLQIAQPDDQVYLYSKAIKDAADRAAAVVQRMLDFSRVHEFAMEAVDTNKSLLSAVSLVRPQIDPFARLILTLGADLPPIAGSREHLEDVWINLLINARDALKGQDDAVITVTSSHDVEADAVIVIFQDNGPGIPQEAQGRVFSSFYTTKEEGVGLGLAICYDIIVQHHGSIHVESQENEGAKFVVRLPVSHLYMD